MITVLLLLIMALVCFIKGRFPSDLYFLGEDLALAAEKIAVITALLSFGGDMADKIINAKNNK